MHYDVNGAQSGRCDVESFSRVHVANPLKPCTNSICPRMRGPERQFAEIHELWGSVRTV